MDQLEKQLSENQWLGGQQPSAADREQFEALNGAFPDVMQFPHAFAWFALVAKFTPAVRGTWAGAAPAKAAAKPAPAKKEEPKKEAAKPAEDDFDPFADEMDDEEKEQMERMKAKAAAAGKVAKHVVEIGRAHV